MMHGGTRRKALLVAQDRSAGRHGPEVKRARWNDWRGPGTVQEFMGPSGSRVPLDLGVFRKQCGTSQKVSVPSSRETHRQAQRPESARCAGPKERKELVL